MSKTYFIDALPDGYEANIQDYDIVRKDGNCLYYIKKQSSPFITEKELFETNLSFSNIEECKINNEIIDIKKYKSLLIHIYSMMNNTEKILQNTKLNIKQEEDLSRGFYYYQELGFSIQGADAKNILKEIINMCRIGSLNLELKIQLKQKKINDKIIAFRLL